MSRVIFLLLLFVSIVSSFGIFSRFLSIGNDETPTAPLATLPLPQTKHHHSPPPKQERETKKQASLRLCPPGGASFLDAFNLICPMRRRKRSTGMGNEGSLGKIMNQCCEIGCEFTDIFAICNPFG